MRCSIRPEIMSRCGDCCLSGNGAWLQNDTGRKEQKDTVRRNREIKMMCGKLEEGKGKEQEDKQ